jgi:hypothetical protein
MPIALRAVARRIRKSHVIVLGVANFADKWDNGVGHGGGLSGIWIMKNKFRSCQGSSLQQYVDPRTCIDIDSREDVVYCIYVIVCVCVCVCMCVLCVHASSCGVSCVRVCKSLSARVPMLRIEDQTARSELRGCHVVQSATTAARVCACAGLIVEVSYIVFEVESVSVENCA